VTTTNQIIIQEVLEAVFYILGDLDLSHSRKNTDSVCWEQNDAENNDTHRLIICTIHKILQRVNQIGWNGRTWTCMGKMRSGYKTSLNTLKERVHLEDLDLNKNRRILLKWILTGSEIGYDRVGWIHVAYNRDH
jgi:hypothetical protein